MARPGKRRYPRTYRRVLDEIYHQLVIQRGAGDVRVTVHNAPRYKRLREPIIMPQRKGPRARGEIVKNMYDPAYKTKYHTPFEIPRYVDIMTNENFDGECITDDGPISVITTKCVSDMGKDKPAITCNYTQVIDDYVDVKNIKKKKERFIMKKIIAKVKNPESNSNTQYGKPIAPGVTVHGIDDYVERQRQLKEAAILAAANRPPIVPGVKIHGLDEEEECEVETPVFTEEQSETIEEIVKEEVEKVILNPNAGKSSESEEEETMTETVTDAEVADLLECLDEDEEVTYTDISVYDIIRSIELNDMEVSLDRLLMNKEEMIAAGCIVTPADELEDLVIPSEYYADDYEPLTIDRTRELLFGGAIDDVDIITVILKYFEHKGQ